MRALLDANLWDGLLFEEMFDMQATMFQPRRREWTESQPHSKRSFRAAFVLTRPSSRFGKHPRVCVSAIGTEKQLRRPPLTQTAVFCAMPLSILKTIDADFSLDFKQAIDAATYDSAYKIAWESRRFWEQDYRIYGGISFPKQMVGVVWLSERKPVRRKRNHRGRVFHRERNGICDA